jgi:hypothetical protein
MLFQDARLKRYRVKKWERDQSPHRVDGMWRKVDLCKSRRKSSRIDDTTQQSLFMSVEVFVLLDLFHHFIYGSAFFIFF